MYTYTHTTHFVIPCLSCSVSQSFPVGYPSHCTAMKKETPTYNRGPLACMIIKIQTWPTITIIFR